MAIVSTKEKTNLKLQLDGGIVDEKQRFISKSFAKVKPEVLDEELYEVAKALGGLQDKELLNVVWNGNPFLDKNLLNIDLV